MVIVKTKNTFFGHPECLHTLFEKQTVITPESIAVEFKNKKYHYEDVNKRANQIASFLRKRGIEKGSFVGLAFDRSVNFIVCMLSVLKLGAIYVPLNVEFPCEKIKKIVEVASVSYILSDDSVVGLISFINHISLNSFMEPYHLFDIESTDNVNHNISPDDPAYCLFTSGSTGEPKGVLCHHKGTFNCIKSKQTILGICKRYLFTAPFTFDPSVLMMFSAFSSGGTVCLFSKNELLSNLNECIIQSRVDYINITPSFFILLDVKLIEKSNVKKITLGGEPVYRSMIEPWLSLKGVTIHNSYGPTETHIEVAYCKVTEAYESNTIGELLDNVEGYILNPDLSHVEKNQEGFLFISGVQVSYGYVNSPQTTNSSFVKNPFKKTDEIMYNTGDIVKLNDKGQLVYIGRNDTQIKISGVRLDLTEIENVILKTATVKKCVALYLQKYRKIIVHIELKNTTEASNYDTFIKDVRENCKRHLTPQLIPHEYILTGSISHSSSGKIDRKLMMKNAEDYMEKKLLECIDHTIQDSPPKKLGQHLLKRYAIEPLYDIPLIDLGLDSLMIIHVAEYCKKEFGLIYALDNIYNKASINSLFNENLSQTVSRNESFKFEAPEPHEESSICHIPNIEYIRKCTLSDVFFIQSTLANPLSLVTYQTIVQDTCAKNVFEQIRTRLGQLVPRASLLRSATVQYKKEWWVIQRNTLLMEEICGYGHPSEAMRFVHAGNPFHIRIDTLDGRNTIISFCFHHVLWDFTSITTLENVLLRRHDVVTLDGDIKQLTLYSPNDVVMGLIHKTPDDISWKNIFKSLYTYNRLTRYTPTLSNHKEVEEDPISFKSLFFGIPITKFRQSLREQKGRNSRIENTDIWLLFIRYFIRELINGHNNIQVLHDKVCVNVVYDMRPFINNRRKLGGSIAFRYPIVISLDDTVACFKDLLKEQKLLAACSFMDKTAKLLSYVKTTQAGQSSKVDVSLNIFSTTRSDHAIINQFPNILGDAINKDHTKLEFQIYIPRDGVADIQCFVKAILPKSVTSKLQNYVDQAVNAVFL